MKAKTEKKKMLREILGMPTFESDPENIKKEHIQFQALQNAKKEIITLVREGMSWQEISSIVKEQYGHFGKKARSNLRKIAAKRAGCEIPTTEPELVKSKRGTWGFRIKGNRAVSLSKSECIERKLTPGPGNY